MAIIASTVNIKQQKLARRIVTSSSHTRQQSVYAQLLQQPGKKVNICSLTSDGVQVCIRYTVPDNDGDVRSFETTLLQTLLESIPRKDKPEKK